MRFASDIVSPKASIHRLLCGLPGYLILFDPRTFVHERHLRLGQLPTQSGFFVISMHFTATRRIPPTSTAIKPGSINGGMELSSGFSHRACSSAYMPFTPNDSEQRSHLTCYRGCWHVISRCLFMTYSHPGTIPCPGYSSVIKGLYNLPAFIIHAASLRQAFAPCGIFLAAASRRRLGRLSVPMCPFTL